MTAKQAIRVGPVTAKGRQGRDVMGVGEPAAAWAGAVVAADVEAATPRRCVDLACGAPVPHPPQSPLGLGWRLLLALTSRPFRPERDLAPQHRHALAPYLRAGWQIRAASPRYQLCWRTSGLLARSARPLVIVPNEEAALAPEERAALTLFEVHRRAAQLLLLARGFAPELADVPWAVETLRAATLRRIIGAAGQRRAEAVFATIRVKLEGALLGRRAAA